MACILGFTVSTAARQAALGVSMPRARATSMALRRISAFSVRVGAMFRPPSVLMSSRSRPGICRTIRWLARRPMFRPRVRSRACLSRVPVDTAPFMRIWFSPLRMDSMAASMAWAVSRTSVSFTAPASNCTCSSRGSMRSTSPKSWGAARPEARASFTASRVFLS